MKIERFGIYCAGIFLWPFGSFPVADSSRGTESAPAGKAPALGSPYLWIGTAIAVLLVIKLIHPPAPVSNILTTAEFVSILRQEARQVQNRRRVREENAQCDGIVEFLVEEALEEIIERTIDAALMRSSHVGLQSRNGDRRCEPTYPRSHAW
jgi:hypothetical protein